jgi:hypothetical protein
MSCIDYVFPITDNLLCLQLGTVTCQYKAIYEWHLISATLPMKGYPMNIINSKHSLKKSEGIRI